MSSWKFWRLVVLLAVLAALAWTIINRSPIGRSLADRAVIRTPYKTEHEWAIRETAIDIERMGAFAHKRAAQAPAALPDTPWNVDAFVPLAANAMGDAPVEPGFQFDMYPSLTALDVNALVNASNTVSNALATNMRDPRAHEAAALVIGAFAMRDAADQFTDVRWALNRMTAHLAVARALRKESGSSPDGRLAAVVFSTLSNQQARAIAELAALGSGAPPEPMNAWIRALDTRVSQDWRKIPEPARSTRLEKLEYFRARRATVNRRLAGEDLDKLGEQVAADFARIVQDAAYIGVQDGGKFVMPALDLELAEARDAYQLVHGRDMPEDLSVALNQRASYLVSESPVVVPWGAWAEFYQRHIAMNIGMIDSQYRVVQGSPGDADAAKTTAYRQLGKLTLFPLGTLRWTKGNNATEADMTYVADVVSLSETAPELINERAWVFFEKGSRAESVPATMPEPGAWFKTATARVPYEAGVRNAEGLRAANEDLDPLISAAPTDRVLLISAIDGAARGPAVDRAVALLQSRHDFDLSAVNASLKRITDDAGKVELLKKACAFSSADCLTLGNTLASLKRDEEAVREFERALADPQLDRMELAANVGWLVEYYRKNARIDLASKLANEAAAMGSAAGYEVRGELYEHIGELDKAEEDFGINAMRYGDPEHLLGFYYRRVEVAKDERYRQKWNKWLTETFPNGLQPEPASMPEKPKSGVYVYADSERSRQAGIRAGDIIVGLEGFRVDTFEQYRAINHFFEQERVRLTLWRGSLVKVDAEAHDRLFGTDIRTYPLKGWIE